MRICVIGGAGYVGLITGIGLAEAGHHVTNVDVDRTRILQLQSGELPIHEPGLDGALKRNLDSGRLTFATEAGQAVKSSQLVFITVGTPPGPDGRADLSDIIQVTEDLAQWLQVKPRTVYQWVHERYIPVVKLGVLVRFNPASVNEWLKTREVAGRVSRRVEIDVS